MLGEMLSDLVTESLWERIAIAAVCCGTLIVCVLAVWIIRKSQIMQQEYCTDMTSKMDMIAEQNSQMNRRFPFKRGPAPFSFAGEAPLPNVDRELAGRGVGRL